MVASGIVDSAYYGNQSFMSCHWSLAQYSR
jgi:hypothetical protein